jgi:hypothetical protein
MFCLRGRYAYVPTGLTLTEGSKIARVAPQFIGTAEAGPRRDRGDPADRLVHHAGIQPVHHRGPAERGGTVMQPPEQATQHQPREDRDHRMPDGRGQRLERTVRVLCTPACQRARTRTPGRRCRRCSPFDVPLPRCARHRGRRGADRPAPVAAGRARRGGLGEVRPQARGRSPPLSRCSQLRPHCTARSCWPHRRTARTRRPARPVRDPAPRTTRLFQGD